MLPDPILVIKAPIYKYIEPYYRSHIGTLPRIPLQGTLFKLLRSLITPNSLLRPRYLRVRVHCVGMRGLRLDNDLCFGLRFRGSFKGILGVPELMDLYGILRVSGSEFLVV